MGIFGALTTAVGGLRAQLLRAGKRLGQHRQLADHGVQACRHLLPRSHSADLSDRATRRRRHHAIPLHQLGAGRRADGLGCDLHGDQRQRLLRGAKARQLHRRHAGVRRRRPLHPPRRLPARQERLSRQRRRLLSARRADRSDHRQPFRQFAAGSQIPERLPAGAANHQDRLSRQPRQLSADDQA